MRDRLTAAAVRIAQEVRYDSLGTFEFLVDATRRRATSRVRLHRGESAPAGRAHRDRRSHRRRSRASCRLQLAGGPLARGARAAASRHSAAARLRDPGAHQHGVDGRGRQSRSPRAARSPPSSRRRDRACASIRSAMPATRTSPSFDSLLAKLIVHSPSARFRGRGGQGVSRAVRVPHRRRARPTSGFCRACCNIPSSSANRVYTRFVEDNIAELVGEANRPSAAVLRSHARRYRAAASVPAPARGREDRRERSARRAPSRQVGAYAPSRSTQRRRR